MILGGKQGKFPSHMNAIIVVTEVFEKLILLVMLGLSVWSVSIILDRRRFFRSQNLNLAPLRELLAKTQWAQAKQWCEQHPGFVSSGFLLVVQEGRFNHQQVDRRLSSYLKAERGALEKGLPVLATLGANAPFIGLFGTVLGIIRAFAYLGSQAGTASVMSGVSQALYATAIGLFVAIPAVVAFNYFSQKIKMQTLELESLRDLYLSLKD